jgi:hypothetical protein
MKGARPAWRSAALAEDRTIQFEPEEVAVAGERATIRWRYRFGAGHADSVRGVNLMRVRDGLIVEALGYSKIPGEVPLAAGPPVWRLNAAVARAVSVGAGYGLYRASRCAGQISSAGRADAWSGELTFAGCAGNRLLRRRAGPGRGR